MLRLVVLALALVLAGPACAISAAKQFSLSTEKDGSGCFIACHAEVVDTINLPGRDTNFVEAVTLNCEFDQWAEYMSLCLVEQCVSAPDVAYAVEYGADFCKRAGVDITLSLPASYLATAGGAFYNSTLSAAARPALALAPVVAALGAYALL
ncbi:hypothetical protein Q5752_005436 [Cryptotrichosporon argae]